MDAKMSSLVLEQNSSKGESLESLFKEMKHAGMIPTTPVENDNWVNRYEKWTSTLQKTYGEAMQKDNLEEAYTFNRKMRVAIKNINAFARTQGSSYLYAMGMFAGVFFAMAGMLPKRNKEQIFNVRMAILKNRAYVEQKLRFLYESEYVQHKDLCDRIGVSQSQLNRTMAGLIDINCVKRYKKGKYSLYSLTPEGRKYTKEILGYKRKNYIEYESVQMAGKKPQIEQKKQWEDADWMKVSLLVTEYSIGNIAGDGCMGKYGLLIGKR